MTQVKVIGESNNMLKKKEVEFTCPLGHKYTREICLSDKYDEPYFDIEKKVMATEIENSIDIESCKTCGVMYKPIIHMSEQTIKYMPNSYMSEDME